ncbi:MAG: hypothetical protein Q8O52_10845 [Sulfuritalea sp.]|nr:hypothetical protein [Sulfuritalea sp.]
MKKFFAALLVLAAIVGGAAYWLSGNIDGLTADAIANYGSAMTKAKVSVGEVQIAPASGKGTVSNFRIGNPAGFKTTHALKVDRVDVEIDIASITQDVIVIRLITIDGPDVIYEQGEAMTNFDAIQKNIASYLGQTKARNREQSPKLIVEELTICNAKARASAAFMGGKTVSVPLPDITLRNIGKSRGGISPGELGQEVATALRAKLTRTASFDRLMESTGKALEKTGNAIKGLFK